MPETRRQFRILYRDFLARLVDLEILSSAGDVQKLLVQFIALLAAASFTYAVASVPRYVHATMPQRDLLVAAWSEQEFLIASTMAIAGLLSVLAWNTVLPDRRDCLVLGLLPVRVRTVFLSKVAAIATALGISVAAVNSFTGLSFPFLWIEPGSSALRTLGAYWLTIMLAGLFAGCAVLAVQAVAAHLLSYRLFLRVSSFLQMGCFFAILGAWFLKPPFSAFAAHPWMTWIPSFWFFGLFQELNGGAGAAFPGLARRVLWSLPVVFAIAAGAFALAYSRNLRRIVEQPDIAPSGRSRPPAQLVVWLAARLLRAPVERAVLLFTTRSIARSRQHRLILAAYAGIALAIGLAYARDLIYGPSSFEAMQVAAPWNRPNGSFLAASMIALFFAVIGARAVFAMPIALRANWVFRLTAVHSPTVYFYAVRKALYAVAALPLWIASAAIFFTIWPAWGAAEHVTLLLVLGVLLVELSLYRFRKIPFACSYLPGKANLNVRLGTWGIGFLFVAAQGVHLEFWCMRSFPRFAVLIGVLLAFAMWARRRTGQWAGSPANQLLFEEMPQADIHALDLHREFVAPPAEQYVDPLAGLPSSRPLSILEPAYLPPPAEPFRLGTAIGQVAADLRYGARILTKSPGFSAAAIALIAVGLAGNTAVYSLSRGILTKPAPGVRASGLVSFAPAFEHRLLDPGDNSYVNYLDYASQTRTMAAMLAFRSERFTAALPDGSYEFRGMLVSGNYFKTIQVALIRGRDFTADEARGAGPLAAILSYHVWQNQFHGAADAVGRTIALNGHPATVIGIGPPGFAGTMFAPNLEIAVPLEAYAHLAGMEPVLSDRRSRGIGIVGRLAAGSSLQEARAEFDGISARLAQVDPPTNRGRTMVLEPYSATQFGPVSGAQTRLFLDILAGVALLALGIVCANVANLMLSRAITRQREIAVRQSIGASRIRILRILMAEGFILSLAAAGFSWVFAWWACGAIAKFAPRLESGGRFVPDFAPDAHVALYAILLATFSTVAFSAAPAIRAWGQDLLPWLRAGEHSVAPGRSRTASILVVAQLALGVLLLLSGSLAWQSIHVMETTDLGFTRDHVLLAGVDTRTGAGTREENLVLLERMRERLLAMPGVIAASWAIAAPPHPHGWMDLPVENLVSDGTFAGPDYLHTLRIPILEGRDFTPADLAGRGAEAILSRKLARALWPGQPAVGHTITLAASPVPASVIGVVADGAFNAVARNGEFSGLGPEAWRNYVFLSEGIRGTPGSYTFHVRYAGEPPSVRVAFRDVDRRIPVFSVRSLQSEFEDFTLPVRVFANVVAVFAVGALLLAALGLYAVIAFYTARRRRELGIRMALGASTGQLLAAVLREGLLLTAAGLTLGILLSIVAAQAFGSLLYGISPADPRTYLAVAVSLAAVSLLACYIPARIATRVDPMDSLRQE